MISELDIRFVFKESSHGSFRDAVEASTSNDRTKRARAENSTMTEVKIIDYKIGLCRVELLLSDHRTLCIECVDGLVDWHLESGQNLTDSPQWYANEVRLNLPDHHEIKWRPDSLLGRRLNVRGVAIGPTESLVFLYVRGCPELMFGQMMDGAGERLLFFEEG